MQNLPYILVVYYSKYGATAKMADFVARGVEKNNQNGEKINVIVRQVPEVSANHQATEKSVPNSGAPYVTLDELKNCSGLILGSPTRFGNMSAALKHFIDSTSGLWMSGDLIGKPAGVFTSTSSMHGGQESTLLSMMLPLIHQGMLMVGVPYSESALNTTQEGGTPYGPSHFAGPKSDKEVSENEKTICQTLGFRVGQIALKLL